MRSANPCPSEWVRSTVLRGAPARPQLGGWVESTGRNTMLWLGGGVNSTQRSTGPDPSWVWGLNSTRRSTGQGCCVFASVFACSRHVSGRVSGCVPLARQESKSLGVWAGGCSRCPSVCVLYLWSAWSVHLTGEVMSSRKGGSPGLGVKQGGAWQGQLCNTLLSRWRALPRLQTYHLEYAQS